MGKLKNNVHQSMSSRKLDDRKIAGHNPTNMQNVSAKEYEFTIRHLDQSQEAGQGRGFFRPALGRFDLAKSLNPMKGLENMVNRMKKVPLVYLPLFALPNAALAMEAPPGFDDFAPLHEQDFLSNLI